MTLNSKAFGLLVGLATAYATVPPTSAEESSTKIGTKPVTTGVVIRGLTIGGLPGAPGTSTGRTCDFSNEEVGPDGRMTGASVNCRPDGNLGNTIPGLPARFDAYCVINAPVKSARVIQAPVSGNANHCDLSGITPKDATSQFKGSVWR
ncbi:protein rhiC [Mesorhizobium sp. M1A.F.Ca.IN.020.30.1.1]|nr:protein rhiC [Mesorhizobium sp. M1A.F.Ca.IN.020.30.1.1]RWG25746.1 MAG: protein rhiC [Mesorhizobium sp.]RWG75426.1 MAG: protein rhiC [Mesorhizobium sp.]TIM76291.1 MAG: protein rhiC [Mesorhizobium sp.]TIM93152.1 MAG: protein rhiC [Mesorhizobium sp.]